MNTFKTHSTSRKLVLTTIFTFIPMFALAFLGLRVAVVTWLFLEGMLLFSMCFLLLIVSRTHWELTFTDDHLHLLNAGNRQSFYFDHIAAHALILKQSDRQKAKNCCDLKIVDTSFAIYDVQDFEGLSAYIQQHCR